MAINLEPSWQQQVGAEFTKHYIADLRQFLQSEYAGGKTIYPAKSQYFAALSATPFTNVKVVILGQDPYHGPGQAHGLCFSVPPTERIPPSLVNIYKELQADLGVAPAQHGSLLSWAAQGVLLLNSVLTVEGGQPGSHRGKGWEQFTDQIIAALDQRETPVVFLLWGSYAQKKAQFVNRQKHLVLETVHPSPLSAHRGFLGCRHFSQANDFLIKNHLQPIDWELPTCQPN